MCEHTIFLFITDLPRRCIMRWVGGRLSLKGCSMYATSFLFNATSSPVVKILLMSGARLSRYLIQIAIHHYFHTQAHFIKTPWVRNVPLRVFTYFLKLAEEMYGEIPRGKVPFSVKFNFWLYFDIIEGGRWRFCFCTLSQRKPVPTSLEIYHLGECQGNYGCIQGASIY